jgi:hypothetical protein
VLVRKDSHPATAETLLVAVSNSQPLVGSRLLLPSLPFLLAPNTGRRCTQGGTRPDFHSSYVASLSQTNKQTNKVVPTERGTPQGSPLSFFVPVSPLLFTLFAEPLTERLRARSTGVELCANKDFTRCLLLADDTCLVASSLSDLQACARRLLSVGGRGGYGLQHEEEPPVPPLRAPTRVPTSPWLLLSGQPLQWTQEVTYLGQSS